MAADTKTTRGAQEREIFLGALEKPAGAERAAFLDAACGADLEMRRRVGELLRGPDEAGSFLEAPALSGARDFSPEPPSGSEGAQATAIGIEKAGDHIGPYKLLQQIGEGGCGVVYMAEQEQPVRRRVALKVIKLGMDTRGVIARFEAERQALALMDHPNIARVLDAGATAAGRPYFVMELVRGTRITEFCDEHRLSTEERLGLFIQVCQAIQHAHQKGIIHRDIKPSNILVTLHDGVPVPKVIDFGIAKAMPTITALTDRTLFTEFQSFLGTPAYMSPEQAEMSGLDIDTRSDIYSLGVLLYELLIGQTPFDPAALSRAGLDECRRTIREEEPVRPSTRLATMLNSELTTTAQRRHTEAPRLIHLLSGDLDWIAMKCLEKDRARRYAAANDLAMDIQNYLDDEPVLARPPSNLYRLQKLLRRHRGAFAAAGAIAATLVFGAAFSIWQAVRATHAERIAQTSQRQESTLRKQAEREKTSARLNEYVADINLAQQSLAAGNYGRAVELLDKHRRGPDEINLRGFEWRYLWQISRGDDHVALPGQEGSVHSLAISPGGDLLAVGVRTGPREKLNIWSLHTRTLVTNMTRGSESMAFYPDGGKLVTASPRTVHILNTSTWQEEKSLTNNYGPVALSKDARLLATQSREGMRIWDTATWNELDVIEDAWGQVAFSPDGKSLVSEGRSGLVVWPLDGRDGLTLKDSTDLFVRPPPNNQGFRMRFDRDRVVAFSPDGRWIVAARNTLSVRGVFLLSIWDAQSGEEVGRMPADADHIEHGGTISSLMFSPDGHLLASASLDRSIRLWDFDRRQPFAALQGHLSEVWAVAFAPDGQTLISGGRDGDLKVWSAHPQRKEDIMTGLRRPLGFSRDSSTLAAQTRDGASVVFLNVISNEREQQFDLENRQASAFPMAPGAVRVALSDDLHTLAYGLDDGTVRLLDTRTREATTVKVAEGQAEILALSPDGHTLITRGGRDRVVRRWDLLSGTSTPWRIDASRILFAPDGRTLASVSLGNTVQLWNATTLEPMAKLQLDDDSASTSGAGAAYGFRGVAAAFSADSRILAVVCQEDTICLWEVASGKLLGACAGHKQGVPSIALSPDGKTLATSSDDGTLKFWNVATQQELLSIRQLGATLSGLQFSPDGRMLVGGSGAFAQTGGLRFFRAPPFGETDLARAGVAR